MDPRQALDYLARLMPAKTFFGMTITKIRPAHWGFRELGGKMGENRLRDKGV